MKICLISDIHISVSYNSYKVWEKFMIKKLKKEEFDAFMIAGDIIASEQEELEKFFKLLRRHFPNKEVFWVRGNHDYWERFKRYDSMLELHNKLSIDYDLTLLDGTHVEKEYIVIMGFDGWYGYKPKTNDSQNMPAEIADHSFLAQKAHNDLNKILHLVDYYDDYIKVCLTHFPPYTFQPAYRHMIANESYLPFIAEKFDYLFVGHSHQDENWNFKGCNIVNCGADYVMPQAKIINILDQDCKTISYSK